LKLLSVWFIGMANHCLRSTQR